MSFLSNLEREPWRHDFYAVLRRLERGAAPLPRIGDSSTLRDDFIALGQEPYVDFPASNLSRVDRDGRGRIRMLVKFLGLLGPQGALPLATTEEVYGWNLQHDEAFPRFLDILHHRFLQLFFRAWADARPIAQHDRPVQDRFVSYLGSVIGIGSAPYQELGSLPDAVKVGFAGLLGAQAKSASRIRNFVAGLFSVEVEVDQFVGSWLKFDEEGRTALGRRHAGLGEDAMLGAGVFSVQDKFRIRLFARNLEEYRRFLPTGDRCEPLADAVFLMTGEQLDWDVELALPAGAVEPVRLGRTGELGYTSWMAPDWADNDRTLRRDARFHPAERLDQQRRRLEAIAGKEGP